MTHLCVVVEVPQVEATPPIYRSKHCWMDRRPHYIIHVICVILKRVQWLVVLDRKNDRNKQAGISQRNTRIETVDNSGERLPRAASRRSRSITP